MTIPDLRGEIVRGPLADCSTLFKNQSYIGDQVFPIKDGVSAKAKYLKYGRGAWFRDEAKIRAPGTQAARGGFDVTYVNITTEQYAFGKEVTREDIEAEGMSGAPPMNMAQDAIEYAANKVDLKKEIRIAELIQAETWSDGTAGGQDAEGKWAASEAAATNTILTDMRAGKIKIQSETGYNPNTLMIDFRTMENLIENPLLREKLKYVSAKSITAEMIGALFGVKVLVGSAIKNTANEKKADTMTSQYIWEVNSGKGSAFLFYRPPSLGLKSASAGGQFRIKRMGGTGGRITEVYPEENKHQWVYETSEETDIVVLSTQLGYAWKDTVST
jgi:hypothetical protein